MDRANLSARRLPQLVEGIDMRDLAIGPAEAFVMSRIDGLSSDSEIAMATGLELDTVSQCLSKLEALGAIAYPGGASVVHAGGPPVVTEATPDIVADERSGVLASTGFGLYDPRELDETADLTRERKHQILTAFYALEEVTHYELLEVLPDADKKEIKAAYYKVVNVFHPDRYFGKNLGAFKAKLERVFARMTEAQETLTRKATREEYDAYLATQNRTKNLIANSRAIEAAVLHAQAQIEQEALEGRLSLGARGTPDPERAARPASLRPPTRTASDPALRKKALARKLLGAPGLRASGMMPAVSGPPSATISDAPPSREALRDQVDSGLRAHYQRRLADAKQRQIKRYLDAAETSYASKDPVSAVNSLRIAVQLDPDNKPLSKRLDEMQLEATRVLADSYLQQAEYEQREGRLERAAMNFEKAALGKNSAALYDRAASCLLEAGLDPKRAGELARKALELAPEHAEYRLTLARIYAAAKMLNSAVKEVERAVRLAPNDESMKTWLKRIKRGEF